MFPVIALRKQAQNIDILSLCITKLYHKLELSLPGEKQQQALAASESSNASAFEQNNKGTVLWQESELSFSDELHSSTASPTEPF